MALALLATLVALAWGFDAWRTRALTAEARITELQEQVQLRDELLGLEGAEQ